MSDSEQLYVPSIDELMSLKDYKEVFNRECAASFKRVYQLQQLKTAKLADQVVGVKPAIWSAYGQQSYTKNRSLHIFAIFSWITQVPIEALCASRREISVSQSDNWQEADRYLLEIITYAATLNSYEFGCFIRSIQKKVAPEGGELSETILAHLKSLSDIGDHFFAPAKIDVDHFKADYYRSVALTMKELRMSNGISQEYIAELMGETLKRYQAYEDPDNPVSLPLYGVMRAINALKIKQIISFVNHMEEYPAFVVARKVQFLRSEVLLELLLALPEPTKLQLSGFIKQLFEFYKS